MKSVILFAILLVTVLVQDTTAYTCQTDMVRVDCNNCMCDKEAGKLTACTIKYCGEVQCDEGSKKRDIDGRSCLCEDNTWYCEHM